MLFSPAVGPLFLPAVGPLFWLLFIRIIHLFVSSQCGALVCQGLARADPRVHFRTFLHVLRVVKWYPTPLAPLSARCACRGRCLQSSCASPGTPRCWSLCLEGLCRKRRTVPLVRLYSAWFPRSSIRLGCSGSSSQVISLSTEAIVFWLSPLRPPGCTPAEAQSLRLFAAVAAAAGCVPRGQRALLNADMLELIDRSACLVEPVAVESCALPPVLVLSPAASTSSAASSRCSRMSFPRGPCGRSFAP